MMQAIKKRGRPAEMVSGVGVSVRLSARTSDQLYRYARRKRVTVSKVLRDIATKFMEHLERIWDVKFNPDTRELSVKMIREGKVISEHTIVLSGLLVHRGIYESGRKYQKGDVVTWDGKMFRI